MKLRNPSVFIALAVLVLAPSCGPLASDGTFENVGNVSQDLSGPTAGDFTVAAGGALGTSIGAGPAGPWLVGFGNPAQPWQLWGPTGGRTWRACGTASICPQTGTVRIAVSPEGVPWRIDTSGLIQYGETFSDGSFEGTWNNFPTPGNPACVSDIGVGSNTQIWAIGCDTNSTGHTVYQYLPQSNSWSSSNGGLAMRVAVSPEGTPWVIDAPSGISAFPTSGGNIFKWTGSSWTVPDSRALGTAIAAGPNGEAWIVGLPMAQGGAWRFNGTSFVVASSAFALFEISLGSDGTPWAISASNQVLRWTNQWASMGPRGYQDIDNPNNTWGGDVEDVDTTDSVNNRLVIGTGGGGVWVQNTTTNTWSPISDAKFSTGPSLAIGSLAQMPGDPNKTLMVATGVLSGNDPNSQNGNGIWKGSLSGGNWQWTQATCVFAGSTQPCPSSFTRIRYSRLSSTTIYAVTTAVSPGLFVSTDGGATFNQTTVPLGQLTDLITDASGVVYVARTDGGIASSLTGGSPFLLTYPTGASLSAAQNTKLAIALSDNSTIYATVSGADGFHGVFRGTNRTSGASWAATGLGFCGGSASNTNGLGDQGLHDGAIGVSPANPNVIVVSGVATWVSFNGGGPPFNGNATCPGVSANNWQQLSQLSSNNAAHADVRVVAFADASTVYLGSDGDVSKSTDGGHTWSNSISTFAATQETSVSVQGSNILATAWDIGEHFSTDNGATWKGRNGDAIAANITTSNEWYSRDLTPPTQIFESTNSGTNWTQLLTNEAPGSAPASYGFGSGPVLVSGNNTWTGLYDLSSGSAARYASSAGQFRVNAKTIAEIPDANNQMTGIDVLAGGFSDGGTTSENLQMWIGTTRWGEIGATLPTSTSAGSAGSCRVSSGCGPSGCVGTCRTGAILAVKSDRGSPPNIYVLTTGGRVFADNLADIDVRFGLGAEPSWIEITGNLPTAVTYHDLIVDPSYGEVIVGTSVGAFRTTNSCISSVLNRTFNCWQTIWQTWGDGLPLSPAQLGTTFAGATSATLGSPGLDVEGLDGQTISGHFYVYGATWGRGLWVRDAAAIDP